MSENQISEIMAALSEIHGDLKEIRSEMKHFTTTDNCEKVQRKIEMDIQSTRIWAISRDMVLLFAINVIAVVAGVKIAFPNLKIF